MMENKVRNAILREFWKLPYKYKPEINYDWQYKSIRLMREISAVVGMGMGCRVSVCFCARTPVPKRQISYRTHHTLGP